MWIGILNEKIILRKWFSYRIFNVTLALPMEDGKNSQKTILPNSIPYFFLLRKGILSPQIAADLSSQIVAFTRYWISFSQLPFLFWNTYLHKLIAGQDHQGPPKKYQDLNGLRISSRIFAVNQYFLLEENNYPLGIGSKIIQDSYKTYSCNKNGKREIFEFASFYPFSFITVTQTQKELKEERSIIHYQQLLQRTRAKRSFGDLLSALQKFFSPSSVYSYFYLVRDSSTISTNY